MSKLVFKSGTKVEEGGHGPYVQHDPTVHISNTTFANRPIGSWITTTVCGISIVPAISTQTDDANHCPACYGSAELRRVLDLQIEKGIW